MFSFLRCGVLMLLLCALVDTHPLSCEEDVQCSEGYYCNAQDKTCYQCLQCEDLNRLMPLNNSLELCVKSVHDCGVCFEGFVNIYDIDVKGLCVSPDWLDNERFTSFCFYIWMIAAIVGSLIVIIFIYVIWNTYVFQISPYYYPVPTKTLNSSEWLTAKGCAIQEYTKANVYQF